MEQKPIHLFNYETEYPKQCALRDKAFDALRFLNQEGYICDKEKNKIFDRIANRLFVEES